MATVLTSAGTIGLKRPKIFTGRRARTARRRSEVLKNTIAGKSKLRRFLTVFLIGFSLSLIVLVMISVYLFNIYAQMVDRRIASGFWHSRSGIYAAPHTLRAGQKLAPENLISLLRQAGYVEGAETDFFNGSYKSTGNVIEVYPNNEEIGRTFIKFDKDRISSISNEYQTLPDFEIEGEMLAGNSAAKRDSSKLLKYEQIPQILKDAIISTEDTRFFEHGGIDYQGIFRAFYINLTHGDIKQGGSTITQQLVKNTFLTNEKTIQRKVSEAFLALALENKMSKEDIFALYCNEIYLGQYGSIGIHGVEQASHAYFGKEIKDLTIGEAATIAAMIKSPTKYSPGKNYEAARSRRNLVIDNLLNNGKISPDAAATAKSGEIALAPPKSQNSPIAPYFVDSVTRQLAGISTSRILENDGNLRVYTTIDPQLQQLAESAVGRQLQNLDKTFAKKGLKPQVTLVAMDPKTGEIRAMVGGRDYDASQFNRATDARRQPGSTFKPFVYAAAVERGMMPSRFIADQPMTFSFPGAKDYKPANYGDSYLNREISLKTALAKSSNVIAVDVAIETGLTNVATTARKFGFNIEYPYPSMALGTSEVTPLELAAAYAAFANQGKKVEPTFFSKIIAGDGQTIYQNQAEGRQVVSPQTAYIITDMLTAVVERGTARSARNALGKNVVFAGKTGSSKDGWFVGFTPNLVTVVWIGFDDNQDIGFTGGEAALPVWVDFMKQVMDLRPEFGGSRFTIPGGLLELNIDPETGMIADSYCPTSEKIIVREAFAPVGRCYKHMPQQETLTAQNTVEDSPNEINEQMIYAKESEKIVLKENAPDTEIKEKKYKSVNDIPVEIKETGFDTESPDSVKDIADKHPDSPKINRTIYEENDLKNLKSSNRIKKPVDE